MVTSASAISGVPKAAKVSPQREDQDADDHVEGQIRVDGEQPRDARRVLGVHRGHPDV